jgi:hypothetical protein
MENMKKKYAGRIVDQLQNLVREMDSENFTEMAMATLILKDKATGIPTLISLTEHGIDQERTLFDLMATTLGYERAI